MKKSVVVSVCLLLASIALNAWGAEKFGSSFSTDYITQDSSQNIKTTIPAPQPIAPAASEPMITAPQAPVDPVAPKQQPIAPPLPATDIMPDLPIAQQSAPTVSAPAMGTKPLKSPYETKPPRITVPDYEKKLQASLQAEYMAKASRKKQSLIDAILEEAYKYGLFFVLGFVILVMLYAMRREAKPLETPKDELEDEKKDIWREEF